MSLHAVSPIRIVVSMTTAARWTVRAARRPLPHAGHRSVAEGEDAIRRRAAQTRCDRHGPGAALFPESMPCFLPCFTHSNRHPLSACATSEHARALRQVRGRVLKESAGAGLVQAVRGGRGERYLSPRITGVYGLPLLTDAAPTCPIESPVARARGSTNLCHRCFEREIESCHCRAGGGHVSKPGDGQARRSRSRGSHPVRRCARDDPA
jgi:hypothetical protein